MFLGEYLRTKDNKGRVFIPSNFREELADGMIVSKGFDEKCLFLFSKQNWQKLQEKILSGPIARKNLQEFSRWFFSSAREVETDVQGRIKIPPLLEEHAGLGKEIVLIGVSDRIEIWSKENWQIYYKSADSRFMGDSGTFEELGF
ncbi:MAG: division/cell wall cluster transcriptional repressor MraZ [Actinobacteria bacterium]|nr:division/cell wall cluster transcriptional repressor MraZ [Actinomycetota bacterium]